MRVLLIASVAAAIASGCTPGSTAPPPPEPVVVRKAPPAPSAAPAPEEPPLPAYEEPPLPTGAVRRLGSRRERCTMDRGAMVYGRGGRILTEEPREKVLVRDATADRALFPRPDAAQDGDFAPGGGAWIVREHHALALVQLPSLSRVALPITRAETDPPARIAGARGGKAIAFSTPAAVRLWEPASGAVRDVLPVTGSLKALAISASGSSVAAAAETEKTWTVSTARQGVMRALDPDPKAWDGIHLAFDAKGDFLAIRSHGSVWGLDLGKKDARAEEVARVDSCPSLCLLEVSPDGNHVATSYRDNVGIIDRRADTILELPARGTPQALAFSPDGRELAVRTSGGRIDRFDVDSGALRSALPGHGMEGPAALSPDGRWVLTAGFGVFLWDAKDGRLVARAASPSEIVSVVFTADATALTVSNKRELVRWSVPDLAPTSLGGRGSTVLAAAPRAKRFVAGTTSHHVGVLDASDAVVAKWEDDILEAALDPTGTVVALIDAKKLAVREVATGRLLYVDKRHATAPAGALAVSEGGNLVAGCEYDGNAVLWRRRGGRVALADAVWCTAIEVVDEKTVLAGDRAGQLWSIDATTGTARSVRHQQGAIVSIDVQASGMVVGSADGTTLIYAGPSAPFGG